MATIYGPGSGSTTWGTQWADTIFVRGSAAGYGQGGDDRLFGDGAATKLVGGTGNDTLDAGGGADFLDGQDGHDFLLGGAGDDLLWGGAGNDHLDGGAGIDKLRGGAGDDTIRVGAGDEATAGDGRDTVVIQRAAGDAPAAPASIDGGAGRDVVVVDMPGWTVVNDAGIGTYAPAGPGTFPVVATLAAVEEIAAAGGSALFHWGVDADVAVTGGAGTDYFSSGAGDEVFTGGPGADRYQFRPIGEGQGHDVITDFRVGEDVLQSRYADYLTGEPVYRVTQTEAAWGTRFEAYDGETLAHTLDLLGVTGLPDDALYNTYALFGPIA